MAKTKVARAKSVSELETRLFASMSAWERWLEANHARSRGLWLQIAKRDGGATSVSYAEALEVALLFGWIDGQKEKLDECFWLQRFTPRMTKSPWSKTNRFVEMLAKRETLHPKTKKGAK